MRWTWDRFGVDRPQLQDVVMAFSESIPDFANGVLTVVGMSTDCELLKVAIIKTKSDHTTQELSNNAVIQRICSRLAVDRIQLVWWSDNPEEQVANSLKPGNVEKILYFNALRRAVALVATGELRQTIGPKGQNVALAAKLCQLDIDVMTASESNEQEAEAVRILCDLDGIPTDIARSLVNEGIMSYRDLVAVGDEVLQQMGKLSRDQIHKIMCDGESRCGK